MDPKEKSSWTRIQCPYLEYHNTQLGTEKLEIECLGSHWKCQDQDSGCWTVEHSFEKMIKIIILMLATNQGVSHGRRQVSLVWAVCVCGKNFIMQHRHHGSMKVQWEGSIFSGIWIRIPCHMSSILLPLSSLRRTSQASPTALIHQAS